MSSDTILFFNNQEYIVPSKCVKFLKSQYQKKKTMIRDEYTDEYYTYVIADQFLDDFIMIITNYLDVDFFKNHLLPEYLIETEIPITFIKVVILDRAFHSLVHLCYVLLENDRFKKLCRMFVDCIYKFDAPPKKAFCKIRGSSVYWKPIRQHRSIETLKRMYSSN